MTDEWAVCLDPSDSKFEISALKKKHLAHRPTSTAELSEWKCENVKPADEDLISGSVYTDMSQDPRSHDGGSTYPDKHSDSLEGVSCTVSCPQESVL